MFPADLKRVDDRLAYSTDSRRQMSNSKNKSSKQNTRILIVDDHPLVRLSLREFIRRESDLEVCGEAEDRDEALACVAATKPHLAIIDLTLKNSNGLELIKDLRERYPEVKILVLSMHDEILHAERAVRAGARGYITKQEATTKIMVAIRQVLAGEIYHWHRNDQNCDRLDFRIRAEHR